MNKAAKVVRRSSVRLFSLRGGNCDLNLIMSEMKDLKEAAKAFKDAQNSGSQYLNKWASSEAPAIQDVFNQLAELNTIWTEVQREFSEHLKQYRLMFGMILEGEKHVAKIKSNYNVCEQQEIKIRKDLKKSAKHATAVQIRELEKRLTQAQRSKEHARIEVDESTKENEAVKMIRVKEGLLRVSEAYIEMGKKCAIVFESQRDVALQLPEIHGRETEHRRYSGAVATQRCVLQAKERIQQYRRFSSPSQSVGTLPRFNIPHQLPDHEAPPPYTTAGYVQASAPVDSPFSEDNVTLRRHQQLSPPPQYGTHPDHHHLDEELSGAVGDSYTLDDITVPRL